MMAFPFQHPAGGQAAGAVMQRRPLRAGLTAAQAALIPTHLDHLFALRPDAIAPAPLCSRPCQAVGGLGKPALRVSEPHMRAFREFITAYQEQVKRPDYPDRERIDALRFRVLSIVLTAVDWITPTTSAIADILHMAPGKGNPPE